MLLLDLLVQEDQVAVSGNCGIQFSNSVLALHPAASDVAQRPQGAGNWSQHSIGACLFRQGVAHLQAAGKNQLLSIDSVAANIENRKSENRVRGGWATQPQQLPRSVAKGIAANDIHLGSSPSQIRPHCWGRLNF